MEHATITAKHGRVTLEPPDGKPTTIELGDNEAVRIYDGANEATISIQITNCPARGWTAQAHGSAARADIRTTGDGTMVILADSSVSEHWRVGDVIRRYDKRAGGWDGWTEHADGSVSYFTDGDEARVVVSLAAEEDRYGGMTLGMDWYERSLAEHCDPSMPSEVRGRVAVVLETAGEAGDMIRGEAMCVTTGVIRGHTERILPADPLANEATLRWEPEAMAALVRLRGLVVDPQVLARMGVQPDGTRPAIVHTSHGA